MIRQIRIYFEDNYLWAFPVFKEGWYDDITWEEYYPLGYLSDTERIQAICEYYGSQMIYILLLPFKIKKF